MSVEAWFCPLCGEVVVSDGAPGRCPACGLHRDSMEPVTGPQRVLGRGTPLSEATRAGLRRALRQEVETAELYARVSSSATAPAIRAAFRALQRVEARHALILAAILREKRPGALEHPDLSGHTDAELLDLVEVREDDTIALYQALLPGVEAPLRPVLTALIAVEEDHNTLAASLRA